MQTELPGDAVLPSPTPRPTVKAVDVADLISYIHHTMGYPPRHSLTAISLSGHSLGAVLRCDWDPAAVVSWPAHSAYARQFAAHLANDRRADGCVAVLFRDDPAGSADSAGAGPLEDPTTESERMLAVALDREFADAGLPMREMWLVARGRVWHVDCPRPAACSGHGTPVSLVETSVINASLILEGSLVSDEPQDSGLPAPAGRFSPDLLAALVHVAELAVAAPGLGDWPDDADEPDDPEDTGDWIDPYALQELEDEMADALAGWLEGWDHVLSGGDLPQDPYARALLAAGLIRVQWRDCLLAVATFSLERAVSGATWLGTVPRPVAELLGVEPREVNGVLFTSVILAASRRGPDWERISHLRAACAELLPEVAGAVASALRCLVAWVEWARGRGSVAGRVLEECRRDDPGYPLGELLGEIVDRGMLSGWASRRETAWSATARGNRGGPGGAPAVA
ncbi:DUF4192 family protein [Citricoccus sp. I39-566]|uniref:DUF4192 family protein n=1 Tax=Citricoccus sp. I39-566 TaxID=3073268 RepID=UPI00286C36FD|nr:DUF4192 family protein [Citricoccus sp. I39-566]WMY77591.1 DUF4192 family protein [Citricoccus sp. I39-566]